MIVDNVVRIERTFQAPAEAVFDAWTSAEVIRWDEAAVRSHEAGWGRILDNLRRTLEACRPDG